MERKTKEVRGWSAAWSWAAACWMGFASAAAAERAVYSAADKPESIAGGKLTLAYDGDLVSKVKAQLGHGEDVTLEGDPIRLAPGAKIVAQGGGELTVSTAVEASGDVAIGVGELVYDGGLLASNSWTTVFPGARLDELSIVSTDFSKTGSRGLGSGIGRPYHVKRGEGTMTVQFQIYADYVKAVYLELKQDGEDVVGRVSKAAYFNNKGFSYPLGYDFFDNPRDLQNLSNGRTFTEYPVRSSDNLDTYGYGIAQLTACRRCEEYVHDGDFLSDQYDTVVAANARLEDVEVVYGLLGYNTKLRACNGRLWPQRVERSQDLVAVQLFNWVETYTRCIKLELRQRGNDVVARAVYAKYFRGDDFESYDFDKMGTFPGGTSPGLVTKENYVPTTYCYGIDYLLLRNRRGAAVSFSGECRWGQHNLTVAAGEQVAFREIGALDFTPAVLGSGTLEFVSAADAGGGSVTLSGSAFGMADGTYRFAGAPGAPLAVRTANSYALPKGRTIVAADAELQLKNGSWGVGVSEGRSELHVLAGGRLLQSAGNALHQGNQLVFLEGGELVTCHDTALTTYANHLYLSDGARVSGKEFLLGCYATDATVGASGAGASTIDCTVTLLGQPDKAGYRGVFFDVGETGDDADLIQNGDIAQHQDYPNGGLVKTGDGTLLVNGRITCTTAPVRLLEGELRLGATGVSTADQRLEIEGGRLVLAAGATNEFGSLSCAVPASVTLAAGARLALQSLTLAADAALAVEGPGRMVVAERLDSGVLDRVTVDGVAAGQTRSGRIVPRRAAVIYIR